MAIGMPLEGSENGGSTASLLMLQDPSVLQARIASLRRELRAAELALKEQQELESSSHSRTNDVARPPVEKKGYLFKWMDRTIGWGQGTKWALRFVCLDEHGHLSYYASHEDVAQPRYVMSLRGCAVRDDGEKRNSRHKSKHGADPPPPKDEPGAYFFLFSIYQTSDDDDHQGSTAEEEEDAVPILRFSCPNAAEKTLWIQRISEACAYCETDEYAIKEAERKSELEDQQRQQRLMALSMPEAKDGTLPPLYFAPHASQFKHLTHHRRRPSFHKAPSAHQFRTKKSPKKSNKNVSAGRDGGDDDDDEKQKKTYPPSKPMHRKTEPSYLSLEAPVQNYRGIFNLGVIVLVVSNVRLILHSVKHHGFFWERITDLDFRHSDDPWEDFPFISGFFLQVVFVVMAFAIEWMLSRRFMSSPIGMFLHHMNAHAALILPLIIVWRYIEKPAVGGVLLLHATITWMKLISYFLANEDLRANASDDRSSNSMLGLVEDLDPSEADRRYPENITLSNIFYFWLCPSLTYQIAFPKSPSVRLWKIAGILLRMIVCLSLFVFVTVQIVTPALADVVQDLKSTGGKYTASMLADYWLRLSIANTYLWLLMFYFYFHLYLNLFAEILRFGDRVFYKDWWNSSEISAYWRLWNTPVHFWLVRHVYFPCIRKGISRSSATFIVFFISALMHELLVSIPFHMVRPWSFLGMMMQMPLVALTKYLYRTFPGTSIGNMVFWCMFCVVGQPMAVLLYTADYQYSKLQPECASLDAANPAGACAAL